MNGFVISAWADLSGGCPVRCSVAGSNMARLCLGYGEGSFEGVFDAETLRVLVKQTTAAMVRMDELYEQEEAERVAAEHGRHHLTPQP